MASLASSFLILARYMQQPTITAIRRAAEQPIIMKRILLSVAEEPSFCSSGVGVGVGVGVGGVGVGGTGVGGTGVGGGGDGGFGAVLF